MNCSRLDMAHPTPDSSFDSLNIAKESLEVALDYLKSVDEIDFVDRQHMLRLLFDFKHSIIDFEIYLATVDVN